MNSGVFACGLLEVRALPRWTVCVLGVLGADDATLFSTSCISSKYEGILPYLHFSVAGGVS